MIIKQTCEIVIKFPTSNIFNWFRRPSLPANMRKQRIDTVRLKLLKIAAKVIHSARYITFKLCSSCPFLGVLSQL